MTWLISRTHLNLAILEVCPGCSVQICLALNKDWGLHSAIRSIPKSILDRYHICYEAYFIYFTIILIFPVYNTQNSKSTNQCPLYHQDFFKRLLNAAHFTYPLKLPKYSYNMNFLQYTSMKIIAFLKEQKQKLITKIVYIAHCISYTFQSLMCISNCEPVCFCTASFFFLFLTNMYYNMAIPIIPTVVQARHCQSEHVCSFWAQRKLLCRFLCR